MGNLDLTGTLYLPFTYANTCGRGVIRDNPGLWNPSKTYREA